MIKPVKHCQTTQGLIPKHAWLAVLGNLVLWPRGLATSRFLKALWCCVCTEDAFGTEFSEVNWVLALRHANFELRSETFAEQTAMLGIVLGRQEMQRSESVQYRLLVCMSVSARVCMYYVWMDGWMDG